MRKRLVLLALAAALLHPGLSYAQEYEGGYMETGKFSIDAEIFLASKKTVGKGKSKKADGVGCYIGGAYRFSLVPDGSFGLSAQAFVYSQDVNPLEKDITSIGESFLGVGCRADYRFRVSQKICIHPYAGPLFRFGMTAVADGYEGGESAEFNCYEKDPDLSRFSLMLGGGVAVTYGRHFRVSAGYYFPLTGRVSDFCTGTDYKDSGSLAYGFSFIF